MEGSIVIGFETSSSESRVLVMASSYSVVVPVIHPYAPSHLVIRYCSRVKHKYTPSPYMHPVFPHSPMWLQL